MQGIAKGESIGSECGIFALVILTGQQNISHTDMPFIAMDAKNSIKQEIYI